MTNQDFFRDYHSNCCNANLIVSTADEGTSCYICTACKKNCDAQYTAIDKGIPGGDESVEITMEEKDGVRIVRDIKYSQPENETSKPWEGEFDKLVKGLPLSFTVPRPATLTSRVDDIKFLISQTISQELEKEREEIVSELEEILHASSCILTFAPLSPEQEAKGDGYHLGLQVAIDLINKRKGI